MRGELMDPFDVPLARGDVGAWLRPPFEEEEDEQ